MYSRWSNRLLLTVGKTVILGMHTAVHVPVDYVIKAFTVTCVDRQALNEQTDAQT